MSEFETALSKFEDLIMSDKFIEAQDAFTEAGTTPEQHSSYSAKLIPLIEQAIDMSFQDFANHIKYSNIYYFNRQNGLEGDVSDIIDSINDYNSYKDFCASQTQDFGDSIKITSV